MKIVPFEITFTVQFSLPCHAIKYTLTHKDIIVEVSERNGTYTDSSGKKYPGCKSKIAYQQITGTSKELIKLSNISIDQWQAEPYVGELCPGSPGHYITMNKENKKKEITYSGCNQKFDANTKMIVNYINTQVPKEYKINL
ncbi:MAG: hypothetical protein IPJ81_09230 [Chitinophagaceae bacterium]|nr:hypothetical protein [Chitinophagaceae bacterium]